MKKVLSIIVILIFIVIIGKTNQQEKINWVEESYVIGQGETLWDIAEEYNENTDIRDYIYQLKQINSNIDAGNLHEGQEIKILVKGVE